MRRRANRTVAAAVLLAVPGTTVADGPLTTQTSTMGTPSSLIEMPTAEMAPDGQLTTTGAFYSGSSRLTLSFQGLPWLNGSFRYAGTDDLTPDFDTFYDRSFDLRLRLLQEGRFTPAVALGFQDLIGTGLLASEYIVATKSLGDRLRVTGGVGWGRLGSNNPIGSVGTRPAFQSGSTGGDFSGDAYFRGDYALFGGASYALNDRFSFSAEYSSDAYTEEVAAGIFEHDSPWNFGVTYRPSDDVNLSLYSLHGSEIGARINLTLNPKNAPAPGGAELAPVPVAVRAPGSAADLGWALDPGATDEVSARIARSLERDDIALDGVTLSGDSAHIRIRNDRYDVQSQALGRTLRVLSRALPPSVETLRVTIMSKGIPAGTLSISRTDLERLEHAPASEALAAARFSDTLAFDDFPAPLDGRYPRLSWWLEPYIETSFFDPDNPLRADVGARARLEYEFGSGFVFSGSVSQKLVGNLDQIDRNSNSVIPRVRSSVSRYFKDDGPVLDNLTLASYFRPAEDFYGRVTGGYLERMYAGLSAELLWKPVDSRLAIGVEANYLRPRDFDQGFGLRSRDTPGGRIPSASGHISSYYDFGNGFHGQLDVGRYLAGDWGATVSLDREFANGWVVGAFMTQTDVSSDDFGEGSFDKGIRLTVPFSWAIGKPTRKSTTAVLRPLTRDGGARVDVDGRLYETVRDAHRPEVAESWGKFWR